MKTREKEERWKKERREEVERKRGVARETFPPPSPRNGISIARKIARGRERSDRER